MPTFPITAVISFCSNDWRFLKRCVEGVSPFCERVLVTVCDHFFSGEEENYGLLQEAFRRFPECTFLLFPFNAEESFRLFSAVHSSHPDWVHEWHNTGRWISYYFSTSTFLFFLDSDEIINADQMKDWLLQEDLSSLTASRFAGSWRFREAGFEATSHDPVSLLVRRAALDPDLLWHEDERMGILTHLSGRVLPCEKGMDGQPMVTHYSWVRTKEETHKKVLSWGHRHERPWKELFEEEYSRSFNGVDCVRHYSYRKAQSSFDPLSEEIPSVPFLTREAFFASLPDFSNVIHVDASSMHRKEIIELAQ